MQPYPAQLRKIEHIVNNITQTHPIIDTSSTGTGKTYTALWAAERLKLKPFVVCPKSAIPVWRQASIDVGVELDDVVNYEKLRYGSHPRMSTKVEERIWKDKKYKNFFCAWLDPKPQLVIFDEAHMCSGMNSFLAYFPPRTSIQKIPQILLSATIADSPLKMRALGDITCMHSFTNFRTFLESNGCRWVEKRGWKFCGGRRGLQIMQRIREYLVNKNFLVQITPQDIPNAMNEGILVPELREIEDAERVSNMYNTSDRGQFTKACVACEKAKVDIFIEDGQQLLEEGNSVVFFVNYHETVNGLRKAFPDAGVITGEDKGRDEVVQAFKDDKIRVVICTTQAGGQSISLHDVRGKHPRVSLISPTFNATNFIQVLGRTVRAGGKTPAIRKIVFAANTIEEYAYKSVRAKVNCIDTLCDGDLTTFEGVQNALRTQAS